MLYVFCEYGYAVFDPVTHARLSSGRTTLQGPLQACAGRCIARDGDSLRLFCARSQSTLEIQCAFAEWMSARDLHITTYVLTATRIIVLYTAGDRAFAPQIALLDFGDVR